MNCSVENCERKYAAKGYCVLHYNRWKRHGDPNRVTYAMPRNQTLAERLDMILDRSGGNEACWEYTCAPGAGGYSTMLVNGRKQGVHRWAYELENGPIPDGMFVLHSCDNRKCANPSHLRLGTHQDNMDDKVARNRCYRGTGSSNPGSKLTEHEVLQIRGLHSNGESRRSLAATFGVSRTSIDLIVTRRRWSHLDEGEVV